MLSKTNAYERGSSPTVLRIHRTFKTLAHITYILKRLREFQVMNIGHAGAFLLPSKTLIATLIYLRLLSSAIRPN